MTTVYDYLEARGSGAAKQLAMNSGVKPSVISRLRNKKNPGPVTLTTAMRLEMGSNGELRADELLPECANLINYFRHSKVQLCLDLS